MDARSCVPSAVHVIIVNFRSSSHLRRCLQALCAEHPASVTVFDNGSGDAEVARLELLSAEFPRVRIEYSPVNHGFAGGVNRAVIVAEPAPGDLLWVLNPDTVVEHGALERLRDTIVAGDADIVSPLVTTGDGQLWYAGGELDFRRGVARHSTDGRGLERAGHVPVGFVTGAAPMFSVHAWQSLGGFVEDYFLYWEDAELSARAASLGVRMALVPTAIVWHAQGGAGRRGGGAGGSRHYYYYGQRNRILLCSAHGSTLGLILGRGSRETLRLLLRPILLEKEDRFGMARASAWGLLDGVRGIRGPWSHSTNA